VSWCWLGYGYFQWHDSCKGNVIIWHGESLYWVTVWLTILVISPGCPIKCWNYFIVSTFLLSLSSVL
jgi:hypothetical protein